MKVKVVVCSSVGKKRKINQDNFFAHGHMNLKFKPYVYHSLMKIRKERTYAICDGMGGEKNGEVASLVVVRLLNKYLKKYSNLFEKFDKHVNCFIDNANKAICKLIRDNDNERMGSTIAMLCVAPERESAIIANVGDTKVLLYRDNKIERISEDHNQAQSLVSMGLISEEEARVHKDKSKLTQHLGIFAEELVLEPFISDYIPIKSGDYFIICSDGLTDMLSYDEISSVVCEKLCTQKKVKKLISQANEKGGNDNITVIMLEVI